MKDKTNNYIDIINDLADFIIDNVIFSITETPGYNYKLGEVNYVVRKEKYEFLYSYKQPPISISIFKRHKNFIIDRNDNMALWIGNIYNSMITDRIALKDYIKTFLHFTIKKGFLTDKYI